MPRRDSASRAPRSGLDLRALGERVRALRRSQGLLQRELGADIGVSYQWIMRLERGTVAPPIDLFKLLASRLGVSVALLIGEEPIEGRPAPVERADENGEAASLGQRITELRQRARLTQAELAQRMGITRPSLLRYESDEQVPGTRTVIRLARALGVTPDSLLLGS